MKLKGMVLVSIIMLAVLTLASVSAVSEDNANSDMILDNGGLADDIGFCDDEAVYHSQDDLAKPSSDGLGSNAGDENYKLSDSGLGEGDKENWDMQIDEIDEVFQKDDRAITINNLPNGFNSKNFTLSIDSENVGISIYHPEDELDEDYVILSKYCIGFDASKLELGQHSYELKFLGNEKYAPASKSGTFNVSFIDVIIPEKIVSWDCYYSDDWAENYYPDEICIYLSKNANCNGTLTVKKDGETVKTNDLSKEEYESPISVKVYGNSISNFTVIYEDDDSHIEKSAMANISYVFGPLVKKLTYGSDKLYLSIPLDLNENPIVEIDGIEYPVFNKTEIITTEEDTRTTLYAKISPELSVGKHSCVLTYPGDDRYPGRTEEYEISISPEIDYRDNYDDDIPGVILKLPEDAKGNLTLYAYDYNNESKLAKKYTQRLVDGEAAVSYENLGVGRFSKVVSKYTGTDYSVKSYVDNYVYVNPKYSIPKTMYAGDSKYLSINLPGKKGKLKLYVFDSKTKTYSAKLVNGTAKISLSNLTAGKHEIDVVFIETLSNGEKVEYDSFRSINVFKPVKFTPSTSTIYYGDGKYKVKLTNSSGKALAGKYVSFRIDGKYITKAKTNESGWAVFKIPSKYLPKSYKFTVSALGKTYNKKVRVKQVLTLKAVKVRRYAKKLVLTANLKKGKNALEKKTLTFKFNGKTYKAKTNAKGIAKVTIKKSVLRRLWIGQRVKYQVTYLKDTVKRTAKARR